VRLPIRDILRFRPDFLCRAVRSKVRLARIPSGHKGGLPIGTPRQTECLDTECARPAPRSSGNPKQSAQPPDDGYAETNTLQASMSIKPPHTTVQTHQTLGRKYPPTRTLQPSACSPGQRAPSTRAPFRTRSSHGQAYRREYRLEPRRSIPDGRTGSRRRCRRWPVRQVSFEPTRQGLERTLTCSGSSAQSLRASLYKSYFVMYAIASSNRSEPVIADELLSFRRGTGLTSGFQARKSLASALEIVIDTETLVVLVQFSKLSQEWQVFFRVLLEGIRPVPSTRDTDAPFESTGQP
jgi:hypothetical protein